MTTTMHHCLQFWRRKSASNDIVLIVRHRDAVGFEIIRLKTALLVALLLQVIVLQGCSATSTATAEPSLGRNAGGGIRGAKTTTTTITNSTTTSSSPSRQTLGTTRVVGGNPVTNDWEYPYFAQLADINCGAALIHDDILLSAAHCERKDHNFHKRVVMGSTLLRKGGIERTIQYHQGHPAYLPRFNDFDFMLIRLTESALVDQDGKLTGAEVIPFNRNRTTPEVGDPILVIGFGRTSEDGRGMSPTLQEVEIKYVDDYTCELQYGGQKFNSGVQFCAGVDGGGKDSCHGDSGGPLVDINTGTAVGVVSYGIGCARDNYAGVNARVSAAADWIDEWICQNSAFPPPTCSNDTLPTRTPSTEFSMTTTTRTTVSFTLHVKLDDYPQEFGLSVQHMDTHELLALVMPKDLNENGKELEYSFADAATGQYLIEVVDEGNDGLCCIYGQGKLWVTNDSTGETIYEHDGVFDAYLKVVLNVDGEGTFMEASESEDYTPSYEALEIPNYPPDFDAEWPGIYPNENEFAFTVNIKYDAYPDETRFQVYQDGTGANDYERVMDNDKDDWIALSSLQEGMQKFNNILHKYDYKNMDPGWYWLAIEDGAGDGICCKYRRGWASVTAPILTTQELGLVWGSNGDFGSGVNAYFKIDGEGFVSEVHWTLVDSETSTERQTGNRDLVQVGSLMEDGLIK